MKISKLYIAEKPSLGRAIATVYSNLTGQPMQASKTHIRVGDIVITWCFGHMYELCEPHVYDPALKSWSPHLLPFIPEKWLRQVRDDAKEQVRVISGFLKEAAVIINAGDAEQEGQLLVDELLIENGVDPFSAKVMRIWVSSYVEADIEKAIKGEFPNSLKRSLYEAAFLRQRADWIHGMSYTRLITRLRNIVNPVTNKGVVQSVGRVQTPTLALVVARDEEIRNFKPVDHYQILLNTVHGNGSFKAKWLPSSDADGLDSEGRLIDANVARALVDKVDGKSGRVTSYEAKPTSKAPPLPFSLSILQQECSKRFGLTAAETLEIAQELYEAKVTTYPRTDSRYLPESVLVEQAPGILSALAGSSVYSGAVQNANKGLKSKAFDTSKVSDHHGIIPTTECHLSALQKLSPMQQKVFDLIARTFIAQFYPEQKWTAVSANVDIEGETFRATGKIPTADGWTVVFGKSDVEADDANVDTKDGADDQAIPQMANGDPVSAAGAEIASKRTTPPAPFNDATMIAAMTGIHRFVSDPEIRKALRDNDGLGTEATRASIMEKLIERGFLTRQNKRMIVSTESGRDLIDYLDEDLKSPGMTALLQREIDRVKDEGADPEAYIQKMQTSIRAKVIALAGSAATQAPVQKPKIEPLPGDGSKCPKCKKGIMKTRSSAKGRFLGCSEFFNKTCKHTISEDVALGKAPTSNFRATAADNQNQPDGPVCKSCGSGRMIEKFNRTDGNKFLGCSTYPVCKATQSLGEPKYRPPRPRFG